MNSSPSAQIRDVSCTIRDLARHTGLSITTVSLALRGQGRMAPETRERVRAAAQELGYQPLPLLAKALSLVRQPEEARFRETLAFLVEHPMDSAPDFQLTLFELARHRALEMGFKLEPFFISGKPADHRRVSRVLWTRGIRGLIVCPRVGLPQARLGLEWEHFAGVEIGRTVWMPQNLHKVERAIYYELIDAFHLLKRAGFRRVGLAVEPREDVLRRGVYSGAFLTAQQRLPAAQRIPSLAAFGPWSKETFGKWLRRYRVDVVIANEPKVVPAWLKLLGMEIPGDISVCCANVGESRFSGMYSDGKALAESCVEMLSLLLERNELGLRAQPRTWLVRDFWHPGETLRYPIESWGSGLAARD